MSGAVLRDFDRDSSRIIDAVLICPNPHARELPDGAFNEEHFLWINNFAQRAVALSAFESLEARETGAMQ